MNFWGSGLVSILIYAGHGGAVNPEDAILTEVSDQILTEAGDFLLIE
jgi:hypothetical protein